MVCNLPVIETQVEKRENPDCGVTCGGCRKQDENDGCGTSRGLLRGCREFRKPHMRGTIAGSLVSVYVYLQECVCVLVGCLWTEKSGSELFW